MKIIPNWRDALRMYSIQAQALNFAIIGAWQALPDDLQDALPGSVVLGVAMGLLVLGIVGRLIQQPAVQP